MTIETVIDKEHLRQETCRTARSLPGNYPIVLEVHDKGNLSNAPKVKELTPEELDNYVELVQEFSRERFPMEAQQQAELQAMKDNIFHENSSINDESNNIKNIISENMPRISHTPVLTPRTRRRSRPRMSTNCKGLYK